MSELTQPTHSRLCILPRPFLIRVNASKGEKGPQAYRRLRSRSQGHLQSTENGLKRKKELYLQKRANQREQLEENLASNPEFLHALDVKECVLEIQAMILGKLAARENRLKGFSDVPEGEIAQASLAEQAEEVEEALSMLKY
jgi:hypothetical protein